MTGPRDQWHPENQDKSRHMVNSTGQEEAERAWMDLGGRLMRQQEEERNHIARELHDDISQRMAILCMDLERLGQKLCVDRTDLCDTVQAMRTRAKEISTDIHRVSYRLHPSKLDDLGL